MSLAFGIMGGRGVRINRICCAMSGGRDFVTPPPMWASHELVLKGGRDKFQPCLSLCESFDSFRLVPVLHFLTNKLGTTNNTCKPLDFVLSFRVYFI
jgi:hypothetical protein